MAGSAAAGRRGAAAGKRTARGKAGGLLASPALARWWKVALLVTLAMIGLPLAHAMFGEIVALLGGAMLLGFLLGRWTAR